MLYLPPLSMRLGVNLLPTARTLNRMRMVIKILQLISADSKFLKQMSHSWAIYMLELVQQLKIARPRHLLFWKTSGIQYAILESKTHAYLNIFPQEMKQE
jgi:hypothetical protein